MAVSLSDLLSPFTREGVLAFALKVLGKAGFPVTAWGETDEPRATIEYDSELHVGLSSQVASIAAMGLLETASGDALTLHAQDVYDEERKSAIQTRGTITLTDTVGAATSFGEGEIIVVTSADPDLVYRNVAPVTVTALGYAAITIGAERTGQRYNVEGSSLSLATPVPGLTVSIASGTSWITQSGADEESDTSLRDRCKAKWSTLAATGSYDAYRKYALDASSEINRVRVQENPTADASAGDPAVTIVVASTSGAPTAGALADVTAAIELHRPLGVLVSVIGASPYSFTVAGSVRVRAAYLAKAQAYISDRLTRWFGGTSITVNGEEVPGLGIGDAIYVSQLIELIHSAPGVVSVTLTDGGGTALVPGTDDTYPAGDAVATLVNLLSYVSV